MSLNIINNVLSEEDINYILSLQEVLQAKKSIDSKTSGSVYFSVNLTSSIKKTIFDNFGLSLDTVPMRWIKGDTMPHIDTSSKQFEKTHLVYLTDSQGEFLLENKSYPIIKNSAFVFDEGLCHETVDTGLEPRLLLGPMSEEGLAVGAIGIYGPGGTSVYIRDVGSGIEYLLSNDPNPNNWNPIPVLPCPIGNTTANSSSDIFTVEFISDITITSDAEFFICVSEYIQFGVKTLNNDGTRPQITISGPQDYPGLIQNGTSSDPGNSNINVFNLEILSIGPTTLALGAGWLCQSNFSRSATDNYIINCYSDGAITGQFCGGIVGSNAASNGGNLTIIGCSSSGVISGEQSGGIVGYNSGVTGASVIIQSCWSTGLISATIDPNSGGCGGIVGSNSQNTTVTNCYTTGNIAGINAGGIVGANPGNTGVSLLPIVIDNCYSFGNITGGNSGGICGSLNPNNTVQITNCYSIGNVVSVDASGIFAGAICGVNSGSVLITNCYAVGTVTESKGYIIAGSSDISFTSTDVNIVDCYSEAGSPDGNGGGVWRDVKANTVLIDTPSGGYPSTWTTNGINLPYNLFNMGYTPYSITNISGINLIRTSSSTITVGNSTNSAIKTTGPYYAFLEDYITPFQIDIDNASGVISTTLSTPVGTYTLYIYNTGSYNITTYTLTVTEAPTPTPTQTPSSFPVQRISLNQKSSFCGTRSVSAIAVGIGAIRGKGSATRIFNNCKGNNSVNFQLCQFRVLGYK
jgi:hypothetical protein